MIAARVLLLATSGSLLFSDVLGFARLDEDGSADDGSGDDGSPDGSEGGDDGHFTDFKTGCAWLETVGDTETLGVKAWGCGNDHGDGEHECPVVPFLGYAEQPESSCEDLCEKLGGKCNDAHSYYNDHCQDGGVNFENCDGCGVADFHNSFDCGYSLGQAYEDGALTHPAHVRCICEDLDACDICLRDECGEFAARAEEDLGAYCACIGERCYDVCGSVHGYEDVDEYLAGGCVDDDYSSFGDEDDHNASGDEDNDKQDEYRS